MKRQQDELKKATTKKGISFNHLAEVYKVVPRRSMYSAEEKKATWSEVSACLPDCRSVDLIAVIPSNIFSFIRQKADYDNFKKDVRKTVKKLEQGRRSSDAFNTTLGVTHMTTEERKARSETRCAAWDAVLNEQDVQQQLGRRNSTLLANLYKGVSADAEEAAVWKAQRAAQEVADMYASYTMDDIEVMEPSNRLEQRRNAFRRSSSCNNLDLTDLLAELNMSSSSFNESGLNASALAGL